MKYLRLCALVVLPLLAACGGGGGSLPATPPQAGSPSEAQSDARSQSPLAALAPAAATHLLYIGNTGSNSITVYANSAAGNAAPLYEIAGPKTQIDDPGQLAEDAQGNLYVANAGASPSILVFAHGAKGDVAPIRKLAGSKTGLHSITAMTVDEQTGKIFAVDNPSGSSTCSVNGYLLRFAPNASGDVAPFACSANLCWVANQIASDSTGANLIWAVPFFAPSYIDRGVFTLPKQFANGALPSTVYQIGAMAAAGVADDPTTKTYLVTNDFGIYRLDERTTGDGPDGPEQLLSPKPVSIISSDTCGGQLAVAPGPTPDTYVVHSTTAGCATNAVYVYANDANGKALPLRVLGGSATKLDKPYGIYEGS